MHTEILSRSLALTVQPSWLRFNSSHNFPGLGSRTQEDRFLYDQIEVDDINYALTFAAGQ